MSTFQDSTLRIQNITSIERRRALQDEDWCVERVLSHLEWNNYKVPLPVKRAPYTEQEIFVPLEGDGGEQDASAAAGPQREITLKPVFVQEPGPGARRLPNSHYRLAEMAAELGGPQEHAEIPMKVPVQGGVNEALLPCAKDPCCGYWSRCKAEKDRHELLGHCPEAKAAEPAAAAAARGPSVEDGEPYSLAGCEPVQGQRGKKRKKLVGPETLPEEPLAKEALAEELAAEEPLEEDSNEEASDVSSDDIPAYRWVEFCGGAASSSADPDPTVAGAGAAAKRKSATKNERVVHRPDLPYELYELCPGGGPVRGLSCKCGRHSDAESGCDVDCRKNMSFGTDKFSYEEVVTRLTWWYHQGDDIDKKDPHGRSIHMSFCPRKHY